MKKNTIPAIFKEELRKFLESINELEAIEKGERICSNCSKVINQDNIQLIIPRSEGIFDYICSNPVCIEEYNRKKI